MTKSTLLTVAAIAAIAGVSFGQRQADWSVELAGKAQKIILQQTTGVPIIQTDKAFYGIDPAAQKVNWTMERSSDKALSGVVDMPTDFFDIEFTPYVLVRNSLVDCRTGELVVDKSKEDYKRVNDYEIIPSLNGLLLRTTAGGMLRLYFVDMTHNKLLWKVDVMKIGMLANVKSDDGETEERIDVPVNTTMVTADHSFMIYQFKKTIACIEVASGKLLWSEKANPAEMRVSPDNKTLLVVEAESGGLMSMATMGTNFKIYSDEISAFDLQTGKSPWKKGIKADGRIRWIDNHPDFLTVVYNKGCNLYRYDTGEPMWKKDFSGRRIIEVAPNAEGYLITYVSGYKKMQVDKDGKPAWKNPQVEEVEGGEVDVPEDGGMDRYSYEKGELLVDAKQMQFIPKKGSGLKRWNIGFGPGARVAYDEPRKNLVMLNNNKVTVINPDKYEKGGIQFNFLVTNTADFHTLEIRDQNYFLTSDQEFAIVNPETNMAKHKYYKRPFDSQGLLLGIASTGLAIGAGAMAMKGMTNAASGSSKAAASTVGMAPPGSGDSELKKSERQMNNAQAMGDASSMVPPARWAAFQQSRDFAYYFTSEKDSENSLKLLIKLNKDTGEEADKLIFDDARPLYQVDEIQRRAYYANKTTLKVFNL